MVTIDSHYEFEKDNRVYKTEIKLYGFCISCSLELLFDNKEKRLRYVANFSKNILFEKLGPKFEKDLKLALLGGVYNCYNMYNEEREKEESLEQLMKNMNIRCLGKKEEWDCIYSDMILKVPKKVKEAIEKIAKDQSNDNH